jgi:hypothetical protein
MKKKFREITINNKKYGWTLRNNCDGDGGDCVEIWCDKKVIHREIISGHLNVTPKMISNFIIDSTNQTYLKKYAKYLANELKSINDIYGDIYKKLNGDIYKKLIELSINGSDKLKSEFEKSLMSIRTIIIIYAKTDNYNLTLKTYEEFEKISSRKEKIDSLYD